MKKGRFWKLILTSFSCSIVLTVQSLWQHTSLPVHAETKIWKYDLSACVEKKFKMTAYYSPLPGQAFFYKWNFEDEVVLNGKGTHGASGAPVFNGMVAAPSSYAFGTQIYFPTRWLAQVEDRWGAIVHAWEKWQEHDRIDFRVGEGEEWLKRALSFGVQTATGYVCDTPIGKAGFDRSIFPSYDNFFETTLWIMQLWEWRSDPWVEVLQRILQKLGYLHAKDVTGLFDKTTAQALCGYQNKRMWIKKTDFRCGYFGPDTRTVMRRHLASLGNPKLPVAVRLASATIPTSSTSVVKSSNDMLEASLSAQEMRNQEALEEWNVEKYRFLVTLIEGETGKHIKFLQRKLQRLGFYSQSISGVYDAYTKSAIFAFQLAHGILQQDAAANLQGYFGPTTREKLNSMK